MVKNINRKIGKITKIIKNESSQKTLTPIQAVTCQHISEQCVR